MSKTFHAQILTPEGSLFDGDVEGVQVPGKSGNFLMLFNHAPIVSSLGVGRVIIKKPDNSETVYAVSGGFVEMNDNKMTMLAEKAEEASEIDVEEARKLRADAKERLKDVKNDREKAEKDLAIAENKLKIAQ
ncbi:ATP synthase F1 subunit epsilon [Rhodohalobacter barkolensis]|uniref:ATP synthase epsilon chain n=1 Tax=Rhodohalobacter barkolensis TaxID=2053187 RepID=A0A2N0VIY6_9BACT|nr:ATP synthase F1 subunit epsilon [Rhodohalobacter barkolensis]PKD44155.1 ATP synthase F1 subunit epsilon [Rhodohalobacter barkolensis]